MNDSVLPPCVCAESVKQVRGWHITTYECITQKLIDGGDYSPEGLYSGPRPENDPNDYGAFDPEAKTGMVYVVQWLGDEDCGGLNDGALAVYASPVDAVAYACGRMDGTGWKPEEDLVEGRVAAWYQVGKNHAISVVEVELR